MIRAIDFLQNLKKISENLGYINGDCGVFAIALASLMGPTTPVVICEGEDDFIAHLAVEFEHRLWDFDGETTEAGLLTYCEGEGTLYRCPVENLDAKDIEERTNPAHTIEYFREGLKEVWEQMQFQARLTQEHIEHLEAYGYEVVENVQLGAYDLVLTYSKFMDSYHIAMQREGKDFADIEQQFTKYPGEIGAKMSEAVPYLNAWIRKYKVLWISGNDSRKVRVYKKILERLGYKTELFNLGGTVLFTIDSPAPEKAKEPTLVKARYRLVKR